MKRLAPIAVAALLAASGGCAVCQHCADYFYPAYGGVWQRDNQNSGRVGSVIDPAGGPTGAYPGGEVIYEEGAIQDGTVIYDNAPAGEQIPTPVPERE